MTLSNGTADSADSMLNHSSTSMTLSNGTADSADDTIFPSLLLYALNMERR